MGGGRGMGGVSWGFRSVGVSGTEEVGGGDELVMLVVGVRCYFVRIV